MHITKKPQNRKITLRKIKFSTSVLRALPNPTNPSGKPTRM